MKTHILWFLFTIIRTVPDDVSDDWTGVHDEGQKGYEKRDTNGDKSVTTEVFFE